MSGPQWKPGPPTEPGLWWVDEGHRVVLAVARERHDVYPETVRCYVYPSVSEVMSIRNISLYGEDNPGARHAPAQPPP